MEKTKKKMKMSHQIHIFAYFMVEKSSEGNEKV